MYVNFDSITHELRDIYKEMKRSNDLKEKELKYIKERDGRIEWLERLKRVSNETLLEMLESTDEFLDEVSTVRAGNRILHTEEYKVKNPVYFDVKNECIMRGLYKEYAK